MTWLGLCMPRAGGTIYNELMKKIVSLCFCLLSLTAL